MKDSKLLQVRNKIVCSLPIVNFNYLYWTDIFLRVMPWGPVQHTWFIG